EIEEMHLDEHPLVAADRRATANVDDPVAPDRALSLVDAGLDGVDAERRLQVIAERQVRSGKTEKPATGVAMLDPALDLPGTAKANAGLARLAGAQKLANPPRGEDLPGFADGRLDRSHADAPRSGEVAQKRGVAAPPVAEDEVIADDDMCGVQPFPQDLDDEGLGALRGEAGIEMQDEEIIDTHRLEHAH